MDAGGGGGTGGPDHGSSKPAIQHASQPKKVSKWGVNVGWAGRWSAGGCRGEGLWGVDVGVMCEEGTPMPPLIHTQKSKPYWYCNASISSIYNTSINIIFSFSITSIFFLYVWLTAVALAPQPGPNSWWPEAVSTYIGMRQCRQFFHWCPIIC